LHSLDNTSQVALIMAFQILRLEDYGKQGAMIRKLAMLNFPLFLMDLCNANRGELIIAMDFASKALVIANR
jgi:hypothetical protein